MIPPKYLEPLSEKILAVNSNDLVYRSPLRLTSWLKINLFD